MSIGVYKDLIEGVPGIQAVGWGARGGAGPAGAKPHSRPAFLPELRPDLVRLHAAGGRRDQDPVQRALARPGQGARTPLKLQRFLTRRTDTNIKYNYINVLVIISCTR